MRNVGVVTRGIRIPIIHQGDDLENIVVDSLIEASKTDNITFKDKDIIAVTESILAKSQGNYVSIDDIAQDIQNKFGKDAELGVVFPIFSRNRFSLILKGIAKGAKKVYLQMSYPNDEVGNPIIDPIEIHNKDINVFTTVFNEKEFRKEFGYDKTIHPFTNVDIIEHYKELGDNIEILFANNSKEILNHTKNVLVANIHPRFKDKEIIKKAGAKKIFTLCDILSSSIGGSGYNSDYGLLGSNASNEDVLKLFPRNGEIFVNNVQKKLLDKTGKHIEVMIYGDGAFKDPVAGIWELADPVVSPAYTKGLEGTPSEYKLKYLADSLNLEDHEIKEKIKEKKVSKQESLGTTPRRITDLVGSLADLTSGSGDRGTPVVHIQGYFDNYSDQ
ncbi:MAG: coenzyme F420-0:L-glutamate ligase [Methanobacteriaceae archaeon]|jgi:F420-0:gamma-glutamyl ligase|nr:coenzyme F420-0:L-glutamate ligase [Candidatus Methanorudis spinitermitis]